MGKLPTECEYAFAKTHVLYRHIHDKMQKSYHSIRHVVPHVMQLGHIDSLVSTTNADCYKCNDHDIWYCTDIVCLQRNVSDTQYDLSMSV